MSEQDYGPDLVEVGELRARIRDLERDLALAGAANDALRLELSALRTGNMRGAAGLDGATAESKRARFMGRKKTH